MASERALTSWKEGMEIYMAGNCGAVREGMKIYMAGRSHSAQEQLDREIYSSIENHLESFAYPAHIQIKAKYSTPQCRLMVDSGAFSAFKSGKVISIKDYGNWAVKFKEQWKDKLKSLHFVNLDVIGDQDTSDRNLKILSKMGVDPLPVLTTNAKKKTVEKFLKEYPYFLLAGGAILPKNNLKIWYDFVFSIVKDHFRKTGVMPKIHLLGATTEWVLKRYPAYSSDSSSWLAPVMFGVSKHGGVSRKLPGYSKGDNEMSLMKYALKKEIKHYQKLEQDITNLWTRRGISFND